MRTQAMPMALLLVAYIVATVCFPSQTLGQDWTRFRGPNGQGVSEAKSVPSQWSADDYNWTLDLQGVGHSSPVVWGDRIFVTASDPAAGERKLHCVDRRSGKIIWTRNEPLKTYKKHKNNSYASSTPCVDEDHVYVVWHSRDSSPLLAFDHQGKLAWRHELGVYSHGQGGAASPIVVGDLVVLAHDQKQPSFLLAVDRKTGEERWKIKRQGKRACYATPAVFRAEGRSPEIVFSHCFEGVVGVDAESGQQRWHIDVFGRAPQRALGSVVFTDDLVIATSGGVGGERQLVAVRPSGDGESSKVEEAWRTNRQAPHVPTPVIYGPWLFMWSDQGIVSCLEKDSGKVVWRERIGGNYFSSPIVVGGRLYAVDLDGNVVVLSATDQFKRLGKTSLGEGSKATPAVSDGVMYLRTESKLFSLGG